MFIVKTFEPLYNAPKQKKSLSSITSVLQLYRCIATSLTSNISLTWQIQDTQCDPVPLHDALEDSKCNSTPYKIWSIPYLLQRKFIGLLISMQKIDFMKISVS